MPIAQVPEWLKIEAFSNYLVFAGGLVIGVLIAAVKHFFRSRAIIEVSRTSQGELLSYALDVRDKLAITYNNRPVSQLHGTTCTFLNRSRQTLTDLRISLCVSPVTDAPQFIEFQSDDHVSNERKQQITVNPTVEGLYSVYIPYLNSYADHKDTVAINIFSDRGLNIIKVTGAGVGWSTKYVDKFGMWKEFEGAIAENTTVLSLVAALSRAVLRRFGI